MTPERTVAIVRIWPKPAPGTNQGVRKIRRNARQGQDPRNEAHYPTRAEARKYVASEWKRAHAPQGLPAGLECFDAHERG